MPRKPENRRVEILLSPEQYAVLKGYTEYEFLNDKAPARPKDMAGAIREILAFAIPSFGEAEPLLERGKYKRQERRETRPQPRDP